MTQILHFCPDKPQRICQLYPENNQRIAIGYQMLNFYTPHTTDRPRNAQALT
jgi:hypothetical protein